VAESYRRGVYDEFIIPTAIQTETRPFTPIASNDSVIFFNFRADRVREITMALTAEKFRFFGRKKFPKNLYFATFAYNEEYDEETPIHPVFKQPNQTQPLAKVLSQAGKKQYHIGETEKFAHVTYFFDGGQDKPFPGEVRELIPSPRVATYDLKPEMSAYRITDTLLAKFRSYDFIVVNFANADMVGHTGSLKATVKAVEVLDECLGKIVKATLAEKWTIIITADHGNAEQMINPNTGEPHTEHTINPVPFILVSENPALQNPLRGEGQDGLKLSDIAPTILQIMGIPIPKEMTGKSLVV
jgi:2,3-bisphosphoglycerate-independent phosphoglycerate mutase